MNCMFLTTADGILLPRLRLMRRELQDKSPNVRSYRFLTTLTPTLGVWVETEETVDGWEVLAKANLSNVELRALWDNEELELQELIEGEWKDVYEVQYPDKDPVQL